ncbi:MAG: hypothetical protein NZ700_13725, partial [Gemmataceae bacterium]|nr:hypothetical protein [Gemmataceae bacterium]MDW8266763.1 hypothetical protein [Gemmataceae bacterium]
MSAERWPLVAYGEEIDALSRRSLGYRLLWPLAPQSWSAEVEELARVLQAAPYPDAWPPTDLPVSVVLAGGERLVAWARYGLADHTVSRRLGGLELFGVVGERSWSVRQVRAVLEELRRLRSERASWGALPADLALPDGLHQEEGHSDTAYGLSLWSRDTPLLLAATSPDEPRRRFDELSGVNQPASWQWVPLVAGAEALRRYAERGPLVAWSVPGVSAAAAATPPPRQAPRRSAWPLAPASALTGLLVGLVLGAGWFSPRPEAANPGPTTPARPQPRDDSRERFAQALYRRLEREVGGGPPGGGAPPGPHTGPPPPPPPPPRASAGRRR